MTSESPPLGITNQSNSSERLQQYGNPSESEAARDDGDDVIDDDTSNLHESNVVGIESVQLAIDIADNVTIKSEENQ